ncbi:4Fe-4S single cluster domain-containing protein [Amphritea sp. 2_MG-2023]|uniref:4Fe-4S single cluster domain-containing protein n=1 Tax=Amphritea TaxID=515417 RepID=UPI001C06DB04|nr:4Fe-4S single cluster domain-containing protein [Amphritea sp. 2_MG-2023]MBU2964038.1 radical SAM protein [Amphritea atlantica]MDO6418438.1 4Fe-4S single cluster domain-containing protein [Amphritea sp. 2_MG-2023]
MTKDYGEYFNIAHIEPQSQIYGPGERFVVWFQGCSLACDGCWNQDMWSFKSKDLVHRGHLLHSILNASGIKGVTFLGGEPLQQSENFWWLVQNIKDQSNLSVFLFTGYENDELTQLGHFENINKFCDIVAIGPYRSDRRNVNQQWIGSDNQIILYPEGSRELIKPQQVNQVEIVIESDERIRILGFPDENLKI